MGKKLILMVLLALFTALLPTGCSLTGPKGGGTIQSGGETSQADGLKESSGKIVEQFNSLEKEVRAADLIAFINKNIASVSGEDASKFVLRLEEVQKAELPALEAKTFDSPEIQAKMDRVYTPDFKISRLDGISDGDLKNRLAEVRDSGFKVETAEGMYFLLIDYDLYSSYSPYVTPDIKDYIDIMATESEHVPSKDNGLVIGWDEVVKRAQRQESFIESHKDSVKLDDVKQLYNSYVTYAFLGANNTPLFSYDTKKLVPGVREAYAAAAAGSENSNLSRALKEYLEIIEKNNGELTDQVDMYRKGVIDNLKL